jgi:hypothetical protein
MKVVIAFLIFFTGCLAVPQIPRMSDLSMHPNKAADMKVSEYAMHQSELSSEYWLENAKNFVQEQLKKNSPNKKVAKNVIFFLGDGMSHFTLGTQFFINFLFINFTSNIFSCHTSRSGWRRS